MKGDDKNKKLNILKKYLNDAEFDPDVYNLIVNSIENKEEVKEVNKAAEDFWQVQQNQSITHQNNDLDLVLNMVHRKINLEHKENTKARQPVNRFLTVLTRIAAGLMLPLLLLSSWLIFQNYSVKDFAEVSATTFINSPVGARTQFTLPDGTTGWLNSNSSISYNLNFERYREVSVTGEVFFDVVNHSDNPFWVRASGISIEVLGTQFNVVNIEKENLLEIVLKEGSIRYVHEGSGRSNLLQPDQFLTYSRNEGVIRIIDVDASNYTSWTQGTIIMRNEPIERLAGRLGRFYGVNIVVEDDEVKDYKFWGVFHNEQINHVLDLLSLTSPIKYFIDPPEQMADGAFSRKTIRIRYNESFGQ